VKRGATIITVATLAAGLIGPAASAADPQASASAETLVSFVGPKKLKVGKSIGYEFVCSVACNITVSDVLKGPGINDRNSVSGSLQAGVKGGFGGKPNGPLLKQLKESPGKFKLAVTINATDPVTGETDVDRRTFGFK
jgi:hypothetical protein